MWLIVSGDGDVDYTAVHGPYASREQAESALFEDDDDIKFRVKELHAPETLASYYD